MEGATGTDYPLGIAKLVTLEKVQIRQKPSVFTANKYLVSDPAGETVLYAKEQGTVKLMDARSRSFHINVFDTTDTEVITLRRPYTFGPDKMQVTMGGQLVSVIRQEVTFMKPVLNINDATDRPVLRVKGPAMTEGPCDFKVLAMDKSQVGVIRKVWAGVLDMMADADHYRVEFPLDLDVRYKAAIISACLLMDFLYFEN